MQLFSKNASAVSIEGIALDVEKTAKGFVVEVEEGFKHLEVLLSHGFVVLEDEVLRRPPPKADASAKAPSGKTGGQV